MTWNNNNVSGHLKNNQNMEKIDVENPITQKEIDKMVRQILKISQPTLLIIDFGNHSFESIEVMRYCRTELSKIESMLLKFSKIAFLSIPPFKSVSENSNKLRYFHSENRAKEWLLLKHKK